MRKKKAIKKKQPFSYGGTVPFPRSPLKDKFKPLKANPDRETMEANIKEMIEATKDDGALNEPLEAPDEFDEDKFKCNLSKLQAMVDLLDEFQDSYYEYLKDVRMAFKLSTPPHDLEDAINDKKENINFMIVDAKGDLDDLLDLESEKVELLDRLRYNLESIAWHFYQKDIPF